MLYANIGITIDSSLFFQGFGEKKATLYDISAELNHRYKDQRRPFVPLSDQVCTSACFLLRCEFPWFQELFTLLTKESKNSLMEEKRVCGVVLGVQFKKIPEDQRAAYISGQEHMVSVIVVILRHFIGRVNECIDSVLKISEQMNALHSATFPNGRKSNVQVFLGSIIGWPSISNEQFNA